MSYPINYPTPQGANVQTFTNSGAFDWVKPQGASFVWFTLIGAGGGGSSNNSNDGGSGGGSGAVTNFMGPAFLIPDVLRVSVGLGGAGSNPGSSSAATSGAATTVLYQQKDGAGYTLLTASGGTGASGNGAAGGAGGLATTTTFFSSIGFYQSVDGQDGVSGSGASVSASSTTFLCGGAASGNAVATPSGNVTANYNYVATGGAATNNSDPPKGSPFFQFSPIIVGLGGPGGGSTNAGSTFGATGGAGGNGCGGGGGGRGNTGFTGRGGRGGDGLVVIITW